MAKEDQLNDTCWEGYEAVGFKMKNGKRVPNCVPKDSKKGVDMKKIELVDNEELTIKSADGTEFVYNEEGLHKVEPQPQVKILKSMRTETGAKDWIRISGNENVKVVSSTTLKSMYDGEFPEMGYHVIMEEPVHVEDFEDGTFKDVLKALCDSGYVEMDEYGPTLSEKWYNGVRKVMKAALSEVLKSVGEINEEQIESMAETHQEFVALVGQVTKSLEDSEALARMSGAPENADTGHERRPERPISDGEVSTATDRDASGAVAGPGGEDARDPKMDGDEVSDAEADTATHLGDHNEGDSGVTHDELDVNKSTYEEENTEEDEEEDEVVDTTFKSLIDAKRWNNPDPERYHVVPTSFEDKQKYGRNKSFIVKPRAPKAIYGAHGNKIV